MTETLQTRALSGLDNFAMYLLSDTASVDCSPAVHPLSIAAEIFPQALGDQLFCELPTPVTNRDVVETLECGHSRHFDFIPEVEPLIAKRRVCSECNYLPLKKPVQSVRTAAQRNEVA